MPKTTYMRGGANPYATPIDLTCPTAKRALFLAGAALALALAARIIGRLADIANLLHWHKRYIEVTAEQDRRHHGKKTAVSE